MAVKKSVVKKEVKKKEKVLEMNPSAMNGEKYIEMIGRRKTAIARVRVYPAGKGKEAIVNGRSLKDYFSLEKCRQAAVAPFKSVDVSHPFTVLVKGGGPTAQAEAIRLGLARILVSINKEWRGRLKASGFLRRDPRMVERKHYGLRKARRAQQWRKR